MTVYATTDDVAARWRPLTDAEEIVAQTLLGDASAMIRQRWPDVDARLADETLAMEDVTRVVASMVKRAMLNAGSEGVEQQSQTAGPFAINNKFANPTGALYITAEEALLFEPERRHPSARMGWLA